MVRPDIVQKLNQKKREEMEVKRVERERKIEAAKDEKGEDWILNTEYGEYVWIGEGEPLNDPEP